MKIKHLRYGKKDQNTNGNKILENIRSPLNNENGNCTGFLALAIK